MLWGILLAILLYAHKSSASCISTVYSSNNVCETSSHTVVSCAFISANLDALCTNLLTGWEIANGPSCSIKGASYGCNYVSTLDSTSQILCCIDQTTPVSTKTSSSTITRTSAISRSLTSSPSVTPSIRLQQNINMCNTQSLRLPIINSYAYVITNTAGTQYVNNMNCPLNITAPLNSYLYLRFTGFLTESGYDFFRVYDSMGAQVYIGSGNLVNFQLSLSPPISFLFTTDGSNVGTGVDVTITSLELPTSTSTVSPSSSSKPSSSPSRSNSPRASISNPTTSSTPSPSVSARVSSSPSTSSSFATRSSSPAQSPSPLVSTYEATRTVTGHISYISETVYFSLTTSVSYTPMPSASQSAYYSVSPSVSESQSAYYSISSSVSYTSSQSIFTVSPSVSASTTPSQSTSSQESYSNSASLTESPQTASSEITSSITPSSHISFTTTLTPQTRSMEVTSTPSSSPTPSAEPTPSSSPAPSPHPSKSSAPYISFQATPSSSSYSSSSRSPLSSSLPKIPILPNLVGISTSQLTNLFNDMVNYDPLYLTDTLNTLATAGLQGGKTEFSVSTSAFSLQIKKVDASTNLAVGSAAIDIPSFGQNTDVSAASVIKWASNPYSSPVDLPVLAINVLSTDSSPLKIQNLTTPISMSWPSPIEAPPFYTMLCHTSTLFKGELLSKPLFSFGNGSFLVDCLSNVTTTLTCKDTKQGTVASVACPSQAYIPECLYWNKGSLSWAGDGCNSSFVNNTIICKCSHLTDFSTRIHNVVKDNVNIIRDASSVYSIEGLEKYKQWYATFGSIGLLAVLLMYLGHSCDRPISKAYTESLLKNKVISDVLQRVPFTPLSRYDRNSVFKEFEPVKEVEKESTLHICSRIILDNSRLQAFFRYDPRLGRMFRILTLFVIQFHSLFVTAFLYGFTYNDSSPMQWYDVLFLSVITSVFNIPCMTIVMQSMNTVGKVEYIYKYPVLFEEYKRRILFEKYALAYKNKTTPNEAIDGLEFMNDSHSMLDTLLMYLCCRMKPTEKEASLMKKMSKGEMYEKMVTILNVPYTKFLKYSEFWDFFPCHTIYGGLFILSCFGWLGWCLNYLLLFAAYHQTTTSEHILISYITSELMTIFISQPLTILFTVFSYIYIHRYGDRFPWPLSLLKIKHTKRIPPVFYYSNPWNTDTNSSLTSELAYTMFVKCPAEACQMDETSYAPLRSILDKINKKDHDVSHVDTGVKAMYTSLSNIKFKNDTLREFV